MTNLLITGLPRSGKTTLLKKILHSQSIKNRAGGFLTEEFRNSEERIGFYIRTIPEGKKGILAQKGMSSPFRVGRYGVDIQILEKLGCEAILQAINSKKIVAVDEIGKMELFSETFRALMIEALNSPNKVLATILQRPNAFADRVKKRHDVRLLHLGKENFGDLYKEILGWLDK